MIPITVGAGVCDTLGALAGGLTIIGLHPDVSIVVPSVIRLALVVVAASAAAAAGTSLGTPVMRSVLQRPLTER